MLFGWTSNDGAVAWYRVQQPMTALNAQGYSCAWSRYLPNELHPGARGDAGLKEHVTILGQFVAEEEPSRLWQGLAAEGQRLFFEMDDDVFSIDRANPAYPEYTSAILGRIHANLAVSTGVIVTRRALADVARQHTDAPVYVIPNYIPAWLLKHRRPRHEHLIPDEHDSVARSYWKRRATVVGWGGSSNHSMDWQHYLPRLVQWIDREQSALLHIMGDTDYFTADLRAIPPERVTGLGWVHGVEDYLRRINFDVCVAPLRQHPFNLSKSPIKALECAALGIPIVASDYGPYHDFVLHGETGLLFRTPGEMATHLTTLVHDRELRETMGANARAVARAHTYEKNAWKWAHVLLGETR